MTFRVGIVAHMQRFLTAEELASRTCATYVAYDDGTLGCEGNHRRVWAWHDANTLSPWSVVLEDDAVPATSRFRFDTTLAAALNAAPAPIVSLYLGRERPPNWQRRIERAVHQAVDTDCCWITTTRLLHAVGVAVRTELIGDMLDHLDGSVRPIDQAIGDWAHDRGHTVAYTVPSLVNHRDLPTLVTHADHTPRTAPRTAWTAGDRARWTADRLVTM